MNYDKTTTEDFLGKVIDPTDIDFRMKVRGKNSLISFDVETLSLSELLQHYSQEQRYELFDWIKERRLSQYFGDHKECQYKWSNDGESFFSTEELIDQFDNRNK